MLYNLLMSKIIRKRQKVITILIVFIVVFISYLILAHVNSNVFKFIRNNNNNFDTVFIITVDTLRKDHVSSYGYPYKTTPFIDMISKTGTVFENAYTVSSHTAPSHTSMFTGLYPSNHGVLRNHDSLANDIYNIKKHFEKNGFKVAGFPATNFLEGKISFDNIKDKYNDVVKGKQGWFLTASQNIERAKAWLTKETSKNDKIFFWLHLYDAHQWQKRGRMDEKYFKTIDELKKDNTYYDYQINKLNIPLEFYNSKDDLLEKIATYDAKIKMINDTLLDFFQFIINKRKGGKFLIILTSDHGEGLGNHNYDSHGKYLYNEQIKVPLVFWSNTKLIPQKREDSFISSIDLFATIVDLVNIPLSSDELKNQDGISYKDIITNDSNHNLYEKRKFCISERRPKDETELRKSWIDGRVNCIVDKKGKYIYNEKGKDEFFDLENDSFELSNIISDKQSLANSYNKKLSYETSKFKSVDIKNQNLTPKEVKELKALGYL